MISDVRIPGCDHRCVQFAKTRHAPAASIERVRCNGDEGNLPGAGFLPREFGRNEKSSIALFSSADTERYWLVFMLRNSAMRSFSWRIDFCAMAFILGSFPHWASTCIIIMVPFSWSIMMTMKSLSWSPVIVAVEPIFEASDIIDPAFEQSTFIIASSALAGALKTSDDPANVHRPKATTRVFSIRLSLREKSKIRNQKCDTRLRG